jgi:hypothetical protein
MSVPTNWDAAGQGIQDEINALGPLAHGASTSLSAIPAASIDGKFVRVVIAGIAGASSVNVKLNGNTILSMAATSGTSFVNELVFVWNSSIQTVQPQVWIGGTPTNLSAFNPSTFTFSTDATHTITSFAVIAI